MPIIMRKLSGLQIKTQDLNLICNFRYIWYYFLLSTAVEMSQTVTLFSTCCTNIIQMISHVLFIVDILYKLNKNNESKHKLHWEVFGFKNVIWYRSYNVGLCLLSEQYIMIQLTISHGYCLFLSKTTVKSYLKLCIYS